MSRYEKIPLAKPDFSKPCIDIAKQYQDSYYAVRHFCIVEIYKSEIWKIAAITGWIAAGLMFILFMVK